MKAMFSRTFHSPTRLFTMAFENFERFGWPLSTPETCLLLVLGISLLLHMVYPWPRHPENTRSCPISEAKQSQAQVLSKAKQLSTNTTKRCSLRLDSHEWQGVWYHMGKYLSQLAPPVHWNFTAEQLENPEKLVEHLNKVCCHPSNTREEQITATCWGLACAYRALICKVQERDVSGSDDKATDNTAAPSPAIIPTPLKDTAATATTLKDTADTPTPLKNTTATQTPVEGTAAESKDQSMLAPFASIIRRRCKQKATHVVMEDEELMPFLEGATSEQEEDEEDEDEEDEEDETFQPLSLTELQNMQKNFTRLPGEQIIPWLLRCWDNGADIYKLEGLDARILGSLAREGGIDRAIAKEERVLSLWRRLLAAVKERYPYKDDVLHHPVKWATIEKGLQYLRELAILEVIYHKLDATNASIDPDEVKCTRPMWRKFTRSAPPSYAISLALVCWRNGEAPTVDEVCCQLGN
ncbi:uncharacterized protein [Melopsittacus undulatus]|uniref:uncharacterized protein n=1 Tax=Melopsittacus undulatus TaxID=13146 RepID=UPI00146D0B0E|nr:uncharacterized protein LOC115947214 [Melopsittacus undulatus]